MTFNSLINCIPQPINTAFSSLVARPPCFYLLFVFTYKIHASKKQPRLIHHVSGHEVDVGVWGSNIEISLKASFLLYSQDSYRIPGNFRERKLLQILRFL